MDLILLLESFLTAVKLISIHIFFRSLFCLSVMYFGLGDAFCLVTGVENFF